MSTITFTCYACNQVLKVGADKAGKKAKCIKCGTILTIPMETPEAPPEELEPAEEAPAPAKAGKGRGDDEDFEEDRPRRKPRDDDDDDEPRGKKRRNDDDDDEPRGKKRRDDDDDEDEPRGKRGRDDDDEDDRGRSRRGGGGGGGMFAAKGLDMLGTIFMFTGVGLLVVALITVFLPWRQADFLLKIKGGEIGGDFGDIPGLKEMAKEMEAKAKAAAANAPSFSGINFGGGIITLILSILLIAFVMVALFVLNQLVFKISLWSAFGGSLVITIMGVIMAFTKTDIPPLKGAWGAWVAMIVSLLASVCFILTVLKLQPVGGFPSRRSGRDEDEEEDDDRGRSRKSRDDDEDDDRGARSRKSRDDDFEDEEPRPKKKRPRDDDD